ncbi:MAG: serine protease [Acholeplasmataceae bacterium]
MLVLLLMTLALSSCSEAFEWIVYDPDYLLLRDDYENYQNKEVDDLDDLARFINRVTLETSRSNVMIEASVYDDESLLERRRGSGVVIRMDESSTYVLTTLDLLEKDEGETLDLSVNDYLLREHSASIEAQSEEQRLALLRIKKSRRDALPVIDLAEERPRVGEQVLLIGFQAQVINAINLGIVTDYRDDVRAGYELMETDIPSDDYGLGGALIDTNHDMVGILTLIVNDETATAYAVTLFGVKDFLSTVF